MVTLNATDPAATVLVLVASAKSCSTTTRGPGDELVKQVTRSDFVDAVRFVDALVPVAEEANHHPDVAISWNKVTLRLSTHSVGGLTQRDLDLAARIDQLK